VDDAMALLTPYITTESGAVFRAGSGVAAITIREKRDRMDGLVSILREYDHPPASVTLSLKSLIDSGGAGLPAELEPIADLLTPFMGGGGLRVGANGLVSGTEGQSTTTQLGSDADALVVTIDLVSTQVLDTTVAVRLRVGITRRGGASPLLRTDITVPLGRSIVLGTAAAGSSGSRPLVVLMPTRIDR
jgi:hypothetical protein